MLALFTLTRASFLPATAPAYSRDRLETLENISDRLLDALEHAVDVFGHDGTNTLGSSRCTVSKEWNAETALANCPLENLEADDLTPDKGYGTATCCGCDQTETETFEDALANFMFTTCADTCLYARDQAQMTVFEWSPEGKCYEPKDVSASEVCSDEEKKSEVMARARSICSESHGSTPIRYQFPATVLPATTARPVTTRPVTTPTPASCPKATCPTCPTCKTCPASKVYLKSDEDLKKLIDPNIPQYQYKSVGEGKCLMANGYSPWARLFPNMDAAKCQQACNVRTGCSGFSSSPFNSCLIYLDPYINNSKAGGEKGWGNCMQKILSEEEVREHWNICKCDTVGDVSKNTATCYHGTHTCGAGEMCFTKRPVQAGPWDQLCRKVSEDEKKCTKLENVKDEVCAWKNPPQNYGTEADCQRQCLADESCIGYQLRVETGDRANCDLILPGCGAGKITGTSGVWSYVSRGCIDDKFVVAN